MNSKTILTTFNVRALGSNYSAVSTIGTGSRPYGEDINTVTTNFSACNCPLIFCQHSLLYYIYHRNVISRFAQGRIPVVN